MLEERQYLKMAEYSWTGENINLILKLLHQVSSNILYACIHIYINHINTKGKESLFQKSEQWSEFTTEFWSAINESSI